MNDTMSLCLATGILAVSGLGLFMYKNSNEVSFSDDVFEQDYETKKTTKRRVKEDDYEYDYKDENDYKDDKNDKEDDSDWFGLRSFFGNGDETDEKEKEKEIEKDKDEDYVFEMFEETKPKKRNTKTKSSRKIGSTRRRY